MSGLIGDLRVESPAPAGELGYLSSFGNEHATEAVMGALPQGRNSPQRVAHGLYAEQLSGTSFAVPRAHNRRSWLYRITPSAKHPAFARLGSQGTLRSAPFRDIAPDPNRLRWDAPPFADVPADFVDGLYTVGGNGDVLTQAGIAIHWYRANRSMTDRYFFNADGEMLVVPQQGGLVVRTEFGMLDVRPGEAVVLPRGMRFAVDVPDVSADGGEARGYICKNYGRLIERPERWVAFTPLNNIAGTPAISLPLAMAADGLPIGVQLSAAHGDERTLLETAFYLEAAQPFTRITDPVTSS